jgi:hypothetical protein
MRLEHLWILAFMGCGEGSLGNNPVQILRDDCRYPWRLQYRDGIVSNKQEK